MHIYLGIDRLSLTDEYWATLLDALQRLGPATARQPAWLCHWRLSTLGDKVLLEAEWDADTITIAAIKQRLANIFGVAVANLSHTTVQTSYGPAVTIRYNSVARLRFLVFAGVNATWQQSQEACREYLAANQAEWEEVQP